jgi:hypothetical protein
MSALPGYPLRVEGRLDPHLSRWLWLVKWLLAIPHFIVLAFLWIAFFVLSLVALVAIVITGRYPRPIFDFNVGVLRWTWRVGFYSFSALGTDHYPPFTLAEVPDYPAALDVEYPKHLSRGLALVKWWLLAIPHYVIVGFFLGGGAWLAWRTENWAFSGGIGLIGVLVVIAAVGLLFTGRYPRGIFDLVLGLDRWALRVAAYAGLMTDKYPPFRLDLGGQEPGSMAVEPTAAPREGAPAAARRWSGGRILLVVLGVVAALLAFGLVAGGAATVVLDQTQRDRDGFLMTPSERFTTPTYALVSESTDVAVDGPDWLVQDFLGTVRIRSESRRSVFVGIGSEEDVSAYLAGVRHAVVTDIDPDPEYTTRAGGAPASTPAAQTFWVASTTGRGEQVVDWDVVDGTWRVVVMNADGSPAVAADLSIGAELDALIWIGVGLLIAGALFALGAAGLIYAGMRKTSG